MIVYYYYRGLLKFFNNLLNKRSNDMKMIKKALANLWDAYVEYHANIPMWWM